MNNIITRKEAQEKGLKRYFTGESCKHGHIEERFVSDWKCVECCKERCKKYTKNHPKYSTFRVRKFRMFPDPTRSEPENCESCGVHRNKLKRGLNLDHDHETGKFRGWLCGNCNRGLGYLGDKVESVKMILGYLQKVE